MSKKSSPNIALIVTENVMIILLAAVFIFYYNDIVSFLNPTSEISSLMINVFVGSIAVTFVSFAVIKIWSIVEILVGNKTKDEEIDMSNYDCLYIKIHYSPEDAPEVYAKHSLAINKIKEVLPSSVSISTNVIKTENNHE